MTTEDFAEVSRATGLDGIEVMSARWLKHSFAPHMHDFYAVSLNYGGRGAFDCRNDLRDAAPGSCNLIAPGELHTGHATSRKGWLYRNLHIESDAMIRLLESLEWHGPIGLGFENPVVFDDILASRLARAFASFSEPSSLLQNESFLMSVVARLGTHHFVRGHALRAAGWEHGAVRRVKEWLEGHFDQNVPIQSLAAVAGLSPYYLVRAFHRQVGIPPHRYQAVVRIHHARRLLKSGTAIAEVAQRTGFCDQSHLTRWFKRTLGVTPGRYAEGASRSPGRARPKESEPRRESPPGESPHPSDADGD